LLGPRLVEEGQAGGEEHGRGVEHDLDLDLEEHDEEGFDGEVEHYGEVEHDDWVEHDEEVEHDLDLDQVGQLQT